MLRKEPRKTFLLLALCLCQVSSKEQQHLLRSRHASQADRPEKKHRVWIRYKGGQRDSTLKSLAAFSDGQEDDPTYLLPPVDIHYEFDRMNAVVVTATEEEIKLLTRIYPELIEEVVEDVKRYSMVVPNKKKQRSLQFGSQIVPYGISLVQADQVWAAGYTGQGVTVCVVDSGFDQTHEDFDSSHVTGNSLIDNVWGSDSNGHGT
jgi:subtilisin family serine protease